MGERSVPDLFPVTCSLFPRQGECAYHESGISNLELLQWLALGELVHVGKHTAGGGMGGIGLQEMADRL